MARYRSARRYPVQWVGYRRGRLNGCRAAAKSSPLGSFVSSSPCLRSGRQADSTAANRPMPPWRTIPRSGGTCWLFARHPFRVRRAVLRFLSLGKTISSVSAGRIRCLAPTGRILMPRRQAAVAMTLGGAGLGGGNTEPRRGAGEAAAFHHLREDPHVVGAVHRASDS
jgi:hypothetical protein